MFQSLALAVLGIGLFVFPISVWVNICHIRIALLRSPRRESTIALALKAISLIALALEPIPKWVRSRLRLRL